MGYLGRGFVVIAHAIAWQTGRLCVVLRPGAWFAPWMNVPTLGKFVSGKSAGSRPMWKFDSCGTSCTPLSPSPHQGRYLVAHRVEPNTPQPVAVPVMVPPPFPPYSPMFRRTLNVYADGVGRTGRFTIAAVLINRRYIYYRFSILLKCGPVRGRPICAHVIPI